MCMKVGMCIFIPSLRPIQDCRSPSGLEANSDRLCLNRQTHPLIHIQMGDLDFQSGSELFFKQRLLVLVDIANY